MEIGSGMLGVLAAVAGNCIIGISQFLQKLALNRLRDEQNDLPRYKDPGWLIAISLFFLGEIMGNFFALSYTSTAVVAPLGSIAIIMSGFLAAKYLGEKISRRNLRGYFLLILGVTFVLFVAPKNPNALTARELLHQMQQLTFKMYLFGVVFAVVYLMWNLRMEKNQQVFKYVLVASILGSLTIMCGKATSVFLRLTLEGNSQFGDFFPYLLIALLVGSAMGQEYYKQQAITKYDASKFWPTFFASFNCFAVTLSLILYPNKEHNLFVFAITYGIGILFILQGSIDTQQKGAKSDSKSPREYLTEMGSSLKSMVQRPKTESHTRPE